MASDHSFDPVDEAFARANPNPDRAGCPAEGVLRALAAKRLPMDDPAYQHLTQCSPCYLEVRQMQSESAAGSRRPRTGVSIAAVVILSLGGYLWISRHQRATESAMARDSATPTPIQTTLLDLRPYAVERSDQNRPDNTPATLPRLRQRLKITLLVGSPAGNYELNLLSPRGDVIQRASGMAVIEDGLTTMDVTLDLRNISTGTFGLALRHEGESWQTYPARME